MRTWTVEPMSYVDIGNLVTYLTFANFFDIIYGWIGIFCAFTFILMMSRHGKSWADLDVALFRFAVAGTTLAVFINRRWNEAAIIVEPEVTPYLWAMVVFHILLAYASAATFIRILFTLRKESLDSYTYYFIPDDPELVPYAVVGGSEIAEIASDPSRARGLLLSRAGLGRRVGPSDRGILSAGFHSRPEQEPTRPEE
jgi:hypothetical protein